MMAREGCWRGALILPMVEEGWHLFCRRGFTYVYGVQFFGYR